MNGPGHADGVDFILRQTHFHGDIAGNVGGKFQDAGPMTFLSLSLLHQLAKANTAD